MVAACSQRSVLDLIGRANSSYLLGTWATLMWVGERVWWRLMMLSSTFLGDHGVTNGMTMADGHPASSSPVCDRPSAAAHRTLSLFDVKDP
jgi:hypothetical protein